MIVLSLSNSNGFSYEQHQSLPMAGIKELVAAVSRPKSFQRKADELEEKLTSKRAELANFEAELKSKIRADTDGDADAKNHFTRLEKSIAEVHAEISRLNTAKGQVAQALAAENAARAERAERER